jgi:hypothetical protein
VAGLSSGRRYTRVGNAFWFRLYVTNTGETVAHDVEVTIGELMRLENDRFVPYSGFLLSNLVWTIWAERCPARNYSQPRIGTLTSETLDAQSGTGHAISIYVERRASIA